MLYTYYVCMFGLNGTITIHLKKKIIIIRYKKSAFHIFITNNLIFASFVSA